MLNSSSASFWDHVYSLRVRNLVPRRWKAGQLREFLEEPVGPSYSPNTITVCPFNSSVSKEGDGIGDFVRKGAIPKAWRVGRGEFQLVADPDDDASTQQSEIQLATARADLLRASRTRATFGEGKSLTGAVGPDTRPDTVPGPSHLYPSIQVALTPAERHALAGLSAAEKAVSIVRKHLAEKFGDDVKIEEIDDGADLNVTADGQQMRIEVEGTESSVMDWQHMKISDQRAHYALTKGGASMYRVVGVSGPNPCIYVLTHGQHFTLEPEPTWVVKKVTPRDERYPLRGDFYRYDLPFEPVAVDDWEIRP